jgi:exodeoxyribonuclease V gamma subunit
MYHSKILIDAKQSSAALLQFPEISIHQLSAFMENPPKLFLNKSLGVFYQDEEELIAEHELFQLDNLDDWGLKNDLIQQVLYGEGFEDEQQEKRYIFRLKQAGRIPLAGVGNIIYQEIREELSPYEQIFRDVAEKRKRTPTDISLKIDNSLINGQINNLFEDRMIYVCNSSSVLKHITRAWVQYLALPASGIKASLHFIYKKEKELDVVMLDSGQISQTEANDILKKIVSDYQLGHSDWFYFHPEMARDQLSVIKNEYNQFSHWYEKCMDNEREYRLKETYLMKAAENGFFEEVHYPLLQKNVLSFMQPIQEYFPSLFE